MKETKTMLQQFIIFILCLCFYCSAYGQYGCTSLLYLKVFDENSNQIFEKFLNHKISIKAKYKYCQNIKNNPDSVVLRKNNGYTWLALYDLKKFVIKYNNQKMTVKIMNNCPNGCEGYAIIDILYFKEGKFVLDCSKTPNKIKDSGTYTGFRDITPYYWSREDEKGNLKKN